MTPLVVYAVCVAAEPAVSTGTRVMRCGRIGGYGWSGGNLEMAEVLGLLDILCVWNY